MLPETDSVRAADAPARDYLAEYARHQMRTGWGNHTTTQGPRPSRGSGHTHRTGPPSHLPTDWLRVHRQLRS